MQKDIHIKISLLKSPLIIFLVVFVLFLVINLFGKFEYWNSNYISYPYMPEESKLSHTANWDNNDPDYHWYFISPISNPFVEDYQTFTGSSEEDVFIKQDTVFKKPTTLKRIEKTLSTYMDSVEAAENYTVPTLHRKVSKHSSKFSESYAAKLDNFGKQISPSRDERGIYEIQKLTILEKSKLYFIATINIWKIWMLISIFLVIIYYLRKKIKIKFS